MNKVILIGNIGSLQVKTFDQQKKVCNFSIAVSENYKDRNGDKQKITEWFSCTTWDTTANFMEKYCHKGSKVMVEGKIRTRTWTNNDGQEVKVQEIQVEKMELLTPKNPDHDGTGMDH
jgi:single-strand DNA-binding protein